jgi:cytochrome c-type biogenesis protein CcmH
MTAVINQKIDEGQSAEQITQFFVAQYGEQVLASPPKKGFNLVAWILPFAALLFGGGVVYVVLRKWIKLGKQPKNANAVGIDEMSEQYEHQLKQELEDFTEKGFR